MAKILLTDKGAYNVQIEQRAIIIYENRRYEVLGGVSLENEIEFGGLEKSSGNDWAPYYTKKGESDRVVNLSDMARAKIQVGDRIVARCIEKNGWFIGNNGIILLPGRVSGK